MTPISASAGYETGSKREAFWSILKAADFLVDRFASAELFLASPRRREIKCLLLDIHQPGMSGFELQRHLHDAGDPVSIVFVTAHGDACLRDLGMKAGASGFLNKPVRSQELLKEVQRAPDMEQLG